MSTAAMVCQLSGSQGLKDLLPFTSMSVNFTLDDFIEQDPLITELLRRDNLIDNILSGYENSPLVMDLLLSHEAFSSLMTNEQEAQYAVLRTAAQRQLFGDDEP